MPNWPRKLSRARPSASRLVDAPMVASTPRMPSSSRPMPVSSTCRHPSGETSAGTTRTRRGASGSSSTRAVMASTAFCSSSRR